MAINPYQQLGYTQGAMGLAQFGSQHQAVSTGVDSIKPGPPAAAAMPVSTGVSDTDFMSRLNNGAFNLNAPRHDGFSISA